MGLLSRKPKEQAVVPVVESRNINDEIIGLWLHGKSVHTRRAYRRDIQRFLLFVSGKPLNKIYLQDLQRFADSLSYLSPASQARILAAVKSLLSFGCKAMPDDFAINASAAFKLPTYKDTLAERMLTESAVLRMIGNEPNKRNHALLSLLYYSAIRREELCRLRWRDLQERPEQHSGQVNVFGKGNKTRAIILPPEVWEEVQTLRGSASDDSPVFLSRQHSKDGQALKPSQVHNIIKRAAERVGIAKPVSPHWMRHAHASHALNRGAPISLVSATLGHSSIAVTGRYTHAQPDESSGKYLPL